jgi:glycosyltransferase involved in cell wall biosynthesis
MRSDNPGSSSPAGAHRVAYVIPMLRRGGTESHLLMLCQGLVARHWLPRIVCWFGPGESAPQFQNAGIKITALRARSLLDPAPVVRLAGLLRSWHPAVVHGYMFGFDLLPFMAARLAGRPACLSSRREMAEWMRPTHLALQRLGNRSATRVIACSAGVAEYASARERLPAGKVTVIYNGVPLPPMPASRTLAAVRQSLGLPAGNPIVGIVARMVPEKAHDLFLDAARRVANVLPTVQLVLCGDGERRARIERLAAQLHLSDRCHFLGERTDIHQLLPAMSMGVLCSDTEGMPNAVLEYMAASLPVVATAVGGVPEIVTQETGILVPKRDAGALAEAMIALLRDPDRAAALGRQGRHRAAEQFSPERMVDAHAALSAAATRRAGAGAN